MDIRTGSSDSKSLCDESSSFDRVRRRPSESQEGWKKGSDVKRELEEKGFSFKNDQGERQTNKTNKRRSLIRSILSAWSEKIRRIKRSENEILRYIRSRESGSSGPNIGRLMKTQQRGPVRSRKIRGRNDNPYIEERTKSGNRNSRWRGDQQREEQESKGASTRRSLFLEVLLGNAYKSEEPGFVYRFF
ncbi:uncharacterized protein TNCV_2151471 [Trichonephila clavipes]|uniref:Uncharacterized protein n=1 Tax=Trichonephila clavipes TaxID=2585209 RepID=A0A8X6UXC9_TRICX|nr:uncharacterized protein TNCV_2151471 [Trichonephila clavipes]